MDLIRIKKKQFISIFSILFILFLFSSCSGGFFLLQPFSFNGNMNYFIDGRFIGSIERPELNEPITIDSGINFSTGNLDEKYPEKVDELLVFHRALSWDEINRLYLTPGSLPVNSSGAAGHYTFESNLTSSGYAPAGPVGINDSAIVIHTPGGVSGNALNLSGEGNITFDYTLLPPGFGKMTLNIWVKDSEIHKDLFINILNCHMGYSDEDFFNLDINSGGINLENYQHSLSEYDSNEWHMLTLVIDN